MDNLYLVALISIQILFHAKESSMLALPFEFSLTDGDDCVWLDTVWNGDAVIKDVFGNMHSTLPEKIRLPVTLAITDASGKTASMEIAQSAVDDCRADINRLKPI